MSDLDNSIRDILQTPHTDSLGGMVMSFPTQKTINQIKQAFADAGYTTYYDHVQQLHQHLKELESYIQDHTMTGAEWYKRFESIVETEGNDLTQLKKDVCMYFARKASGLSDE